MAGAAKVWTRFRGLEAAVPLAPPPPAFQALPVPAGINHGAGLIGLGGEALLACCYSGASEAGPDVVILCSRSQDGGVAWSVPAAASRPQQTALGAPRPAKSVGNVVLARDRAGRLIMITSEIQSRQIAGVEVCRTWRCGRIDFRISLDAGRSWSAPTRLDDRPGALPRSRPLAVAGLGDLLPVYQEGRRPSVLRLDLAALTAGQRPQAQAMAIPDSGGLLQPTLAVGSDGGLLAYLRDHRRRAVRVSQFDPASGMWAAPQATDLPNPDSAIEAVAGDGGKAALIYNPSHRDRGSLALAFSNDGVHFAHGCVLVPRGAAGEVAYPAAVRLGTGWGVAFSTGGKRGIAFLRLDRAFLNSCAAAPRA